VYERRKKRGGEQNAEAAAHERQDEAFGDAGELSALFLAAVGIYGVMAYLVSQRAPEIAIRMALGAQRWMVFRLIVGQGMKLVLIGLALGLTLSFAVTRLLSTLLFGTSPTDLVTITGASLLFAIVAFGACYLPSRRAMRLDAVAALRSM
jgi:ABC-type antimicrobial peptide transport system permease subunit